jgi:hypothetical protein
VAIVFNAADMIKKNLAVPGLTLSPVVYAGRYQSGAEAIGKQFAKIADAVESQMALLKNTPEVQVIDHVLEALVSAVICTKHHAFLEEQEWRLVWIALYKLLPQLESRVEAISGLPQRVFCLKFSDYPSQSFAEQSIPALVDRVLIGPCEHSGLVLDALHRVLVERGIDPNVIETEIPLRL